MSNFPQDAATIGTEFNFATGQYERVPAFFAVKVCDFCSDPLDEKAVVFNHDYFAVNAWIPTFGKITLCEYPAGTWAACAICAPLAHDADLRGLVARSVMTHETDQVDLIRLMHRGFLENRIPGPPVPILFLEQLGQ
jgi:hypothetical protein